MTYNPSSRHRQQRYDFASYLQDIPPRPTPKSGLFAKAARCLKERARDHKKLALDVVATTGVVLGAFAEADYFIHNVYSPSFVVLSTAPALCYAAIPFYKKLKASFGLRSLLLAGVDFVHTASTYPMQIARNLLLLTAAGLAAATLTQNVLHPLPTQKPRMLRMMEAAEKQKPSAPPLDGILVYAAHGASGTKPVSTDTPPAQQPKQTKRRTAQRPPLSDLSVPHPFVPNQAYLNYP